MFAEIAFISQALVAALAEADALVRAGNFGPDLVDVMRHARDVGGMLDEAVERAGSAVDAATREMATQLTAAVESLEKQVPGNGSPH